MVRRLLFIVPAVLALSAGNAGAAPLDKSANEKVDQAINEHYLATDFRKAEAVLLGVVKACGTQCSPATLARAWMYVGLVRGSGNQDLAGAREAFDNAVGQDPAVKLDVALSTPETVEVFNQAKSGGGTAPTSSTTPAATEPAASGGGVVTMECTPAVREVQTNRPIPVSCTAPPGAATLELAYRDGPNGAYTTVLFTRTGSLLSATVPCEATAAAGALHLYVVASSSSGELVGQWGTPDGPVVIGLVEDTNMAPPALPGQKAPDRCSGGGEAGALAIDSGGKADCPPGFPGCSGGGAWGDSCTPAEPCKEGLMCQEGVCENAASCDSDADCDSGVCSDGFCQSESGGAGGSGHYAKNWVGVHFGVDLPIMSGNSVCFRGGGWNDGFRCYESGANSPIESTDIWSTGASGSAVMGTMRVMASYDRFFTPKLAAGARLGFAFGGGKADFNPIHAEARVSYWFIGVNDLGFNPYVFAGGGMGQVNGVEKAEICDWITVDPDGSEGPEPPQEGCVQGTNRKVDAYKLMGLGFVEAGAGGLLALQQNGGIVLNVAAMYMFPFPGINIQPSLGYMMGF